MVENSLGIEILREVTRIANSTLDLDETLRHIIDVIKKKMSIDACAIHLIDEEGTHLTLRASSGLPEVPSSQIRLEIGKGVTGWVARQQTTLALTDARHDERFVYFPEIQEEKFQSMLSVPITMNEGSIGVINVHTYEERQFSELEISLLETIASQVSGCIHNAMIYHKSQVLIKELTILYDVSLAVQTTLKLEHGMWIILSAITMGEAGGFNRAMLFVLNEKTHVLQGMMGLGPDSPEDAHRIWTELGRQDEGNLLEWIIKEADKDQYRQSEFNSFVRSLRFPVRTGESVLAETVLQKKPFIVSDAKNHPLVQNDFLKALGSEAFATVPLIAHEEVLGVILVDNRYDRKPITEEQLRLLTRFVTHASWVMENSRLFSKLLDTNRELLSTKELLIQSEKLAALGEMAAQVAHEIKNPLVSIGGFARRLQEKIRKIQLAGESRPEIETAAHYSKIIVTEAVRLEALLHDILVFSRTGALKLEEHNINGLLTEVILLFQSGLYEKNIHLHSRLAPDIPSFPIDKQQIKQVLLNLFYNAMESMALGGELTVETFKDQYIGQQDVVTIKIADTGGGIPQEVFGNIFNPFFTTKDSGTGLGLSICRKIIEGHGGTIRIENKIDEGVTVFLHLPLQKRTDYYKN